MKGFKLSHKLLNQSIETAEFSQQKTLKKKTRKKLRKISKKLYKLSCGVVNK